MTTSSRKPLPLAPLLRIYSEAGLLEPSQLVQLPDIGPRFAAIAAARESLLSETFLDHASEAEFETALVAFHKACVRAPRPTDTLGSGAGVIRHALGHLLRCPDPLPRRAERCLTPRGPYYVAELNLEFWSALFQALDLAHNPGWTPFIEAGLRRLRLARWHSQAQAAQVYPALRDTYADLRAAHPQLSPFHLDHFLTLVGRMSGRDLWSSTVESTAVSRPATRTRFAGFCTDTFRFLEDLGRNNLLVWMNGERERYRFAVREPWVELCKALAERYVVPILRGAHGWDLETAARSGRALSSVCKNDYGRSGPYQNVLWITFFRRDHRDRRGDAQFFVRLSPTGLCYGLRIGADAREAAALFRQNVAKSGELLFTALDHGGALADCRFGTEDVAQPDPDAAFVAPANPAALAEWAGHKVLVAAKTLSPDAALLRTDDLVGDILLTFDRLVPAYACAIESDPRPLLARRAGCAEGFREYTAVDFHRDTYLDRDWLERARGLLTLKRQLILQGVPGTGKTHVARCLARFLAGGREEAIRLVQFHPAYSYEEFVEGIKVKSVEADGRHDITYPIEDGLLCAFATEATRRPDDPHVLVIDEINRGNLPRIFGELLYLLEYREQAVTLPYSKRNFQLPANLYVLGTMNAADRGVTLLDQALRRRFSFLEMLPDAAVLRTWLAKHPPAEGPEFADTVVGIFERLNSRLRADLGSQAQIGHSYFLVPRLDTIRLRAVWEHQIEPILAECFPADAARLAAYGLDGFLTGKHARRGGRTRTAALD